MPAMAYDSASGRHLLFGGSRNSIALGDTYTFSNATQRWTLQKPSASPSPREWAAAAFVAGPLNRVVLFGGSRYPGGGYSQEILCDMWSWTGTTWKAIGQTNGPCLTGHSMAWDGARLVVTGGFVDWNNTWNDGVWTFDFTPDGTAGTWTYESDWYSYFQCTGADELHTDARMAYDRPSGKMVFFGGGENVEVLGAVAYDDLSVCD